MKKSAFTLIELLVVIAIISIIAALTTVALSSVRGKGRDTKRISDIKQIQSALEMYKNDNGGYPTAMASGNSLVYSTQTYMKTVPTAPGKPDGNCSSDTYTYTYNSTTGAYKLTYCLGQAVQTAGPADCIARPGNICSGPAIGENYQGGKIFYIFQAGDTGYVAGQTHGLIYAIGGGGSGAWITGGNTQTTTNGNTSTVVGSGQANTTAMMAQTGYTGGMAKSCDDYVNLDTGTGVYSDWYLPSKDDLGKMYLSSADTGFSSGCFLEGSSEYSSSLIWCIFQGVQYQCNKGTTGNCYIPIRSF